MKLKTAVWNNLLYTAIQFILPIITMCWLAQILQSSGFGKLSWLEASSRVLVLLITLGIPYFGSKSLAQIENQHERRLLFSSLLGIMLYSICLFSLLGVLDVFYLRIWKNYGWLILFYAVVQLGSLEWYFQGVQEYRFILYRTAIIRFMAFLSTVYLVKTPSDVYTAFGILLASQLAITLITLYYVRDKIVLTRVWKPNFSRDQKRRLLLLSLVSVAMLGYTVFDTVLLGLLSSPGQTGDYSLAIRLTKLPMIFMGSVVTVTMIHGSKLVKLESEETFSWLMQKSLTLLWLVLLPITVYLYVASNALLLLIGGETYQHAGKTMQILVWILPMIAISNVSGIQILLAQNRESDFLKIVGFSCLLAIAGFVLCIPPWGAEGAASVTLITESLVALGTLYYARPWLKSSKLWQFMGFWALWMLPLFSILEILSLVHLSSIISLIVMALIVAVYVILVLFWVLKERWIFTLMKGLHP